MNISRLINQIHRNARETINCFHFSLTVLATSLSSFCGSQQQRQLISAWCIACQGSYVATLRHPFPRYIYNLFCMPLFAALEILFVFHFFHSAPAIVACTSILCRQCRVSFPLFFSECGASCGGAWLWCCKYTKLNNWVNGTNILSIFFIFYCYSFYILYTYVYMLHVVYIFLFLFDKSPCHVSAGKTTPTWQGQGGAQEVAPACALPRSPPKNIYHVQIFHVVLLLS